MVVDVREITHQRDEKGELIPEEVKLELLDESQSIKVVPIQRGKLQKIYSMARSTNIDEQTNSDREIIKNGLYEPKLTDKQLDDLKTNYAGAIQVAILSYSLGISQKDLNEKLNSQGGNMNVISEEINNLKKK